MHLVFLAVLAGLALPASAVGQTVGPTTWSIAPRTGSAAEGWPVDPLPTWSIPSRHGRAAPVPLPRIGLPLPPTGLPPIHGSNPGRRHHRGRAVAAWPFWVMVVPETAAAIAPDPPPAQTAPIEEPS